MPNGKEYLNELELEKEIKGMGTRELLEFTARQSYETTVCVAGHEKRITVLEKRKTRTTGVWAGIGTGIGAAIVALINFFRG